MPGAPLLLQANRRHADRHLLDGNAGSAPSNDLENCCWVSPSPGWGLMGPLPLLSSTTAPAHPSLLSPALEAPSDPGRPPAVLASSSPSPLSVCCHCCISRPARWFPALDVKWERRELATRHPGSHPCPGPCRSMSFGVSRRPDLASPRVHAAAGGASPGAGAGTGTIPALGAVGFGQAEGSG